MSENMRRTTLVAADGTQHEYTTSMHRALKGRKLFHKIQMSLMKAGGYAAELLAGVASALPEDAGGEEEDRDVKLFDIIKEIDIDSDSLFNALMPTLDLLSEDDQFMLDLFSTTTRDGRNLNAGHIESAYAANYAEMYEAQMWVIKENFLVPLVCWVNQKFGLSLDPQNVTEGLRNILSQAESTSSSGS